ncbi:nicotinic acetylcholine receptor subunit beta3-like protein [Dinothrombium tinctorium]|uniref:Nicotinic acetylcholine receptor subunit beta3-like protein n=1 Tax=Dinothrombium tinctorium TaxID=1965070 RepID=A0A443QVW7_9ACAR|nr:nicotinic acetylcholine receptor subunit beta3-like protein [Dinothrombium tinctorium]
MMLFETKFQEDGDGLLSKEWKDENLVWNASQYNNLGVVQSAFEQVWTPDLIAWNSKSPTSSEELKQSHLTVNSSGYVWWGTGATLNTYCYINLDDYAFDKQQCRIDLGCWMHSQLEINITKFHDSEDSIYGPYASNPEWDSSKVSEEWRNTGKQFRTSLLVITTFWTPIGSKFRYLYTNIALYVA